MITPGGSLTESQQRQIRQAAEEAYDALRWIVGDNGAVPQHLHNLARDSFVEGLRHANRALAAVDKTNSEALRALHAHIAALTAELERARGEHYRIHETLTDRIAALRTALAAVVELNLPDALPSQMLAYGHPWPAVARALWPDLAPDAPR